MNHQNPKSINKIISVFCFLILISTLFFSLPTIAEPIAPSIDGQNGIEEPIVINSIDSPSTPRTVIDREIEDNEVMYAIIAPKAFEQVLIPLVNWKTYKGVPAKIFTLESIYANYSDGVDNAENIHKFLRNLEKNSPALTYVLLAGDADVVPTRKLYANAELFSLDREYVSDFYYAGLDSDWDKDNDGKYGEGTDASDTPVFEGEWTPNVYVSRIPAGNSSDMNISVTDILNYETNITQGNWMKKALFWGGLMDAPNVPSYNPNSTNAYKVKELMAKPVFQNLAPNMQIKTRYDYAQLPGDQYLYSNDLLTRSNAIFDFNSGCSILNFAGQAYYQGLAILHYDDPAGTKLISESGSYSVLFYGTDGEFSTNGKKMPLVTSFTCGSGDFAETGTYEDETLERFLFGPDGGAIGLVASTGKTYRGEAPKSDGNWWMDKRYFEILLNNSGTYQPCNSFYKLKQDYVNQIMKKTTTYQEKYKAQLFGYNYMGDPELSIWTDLPGNMQINVSGLWPGPHNITVKVYDQFMNVIPNARVCIQNDELYNYGVTDENGKVEIFVNPTQLDSVKVVITAHNFLVYDNSFDLKVEPADPKITSNDIEFSVDSPSAGMEIKINATILNRGKTDLNTPFNVTFSLDGLIGSGGTQIGTDQIISEITKGSTKTVGVTWDVAPGYHEIFVEIDRENKISESYKWNNIASKQLYVRRPDVYITTQDITFTPSENVYEGSNVQIKAEIHNSGDAVAKNVKVTFIDSKFPLLDKIIGTNKTINSIDVDSFQTVSTTWKSLGGKHKIIVKVDPDDVLIEFSKKNNTASKNITIKYAPKISKLRDIELDEDTVMKNATILTYLITDEDTSILDLNITVESSDDSCEVILNQFYGLDIYPAQDWYGNSSVTVTISDGIKAVNDTFIVTVKSKNDPPQFNSTNYTIYATEDFELSYFVKAFDPESDKITFTDDTELFDIDENTGEIRFTPQQKHVNDSPYNFSITLSDGIIHGQAQLFTLIIINTPNSPEILHISNQNVTANESFYLKIEIIDIDSTELFFKDNSHLFAIDSSTGIISFTPSEVDVGEYMIEITVSDETNRADNITFKLTINSSGDVDGNGDDGNGDGNETGNGKSDGDDGLSSMMFILLLVVIIIIVVLILVFLLFRTRKKKKVTDEFFSPDSDRPNNEKSYDYLDGEGKSSPASSPKGPNYDEEYQKLYSDLPSVASSKEPRKTKRDNKPPKGTRKGKGKNKNKGKGEISTNTKSRKPSKTEEETIDWDIDNDNVDDDNEIEFEEIGAKSKKKGKSKGKSKRKR